MRRILAAAGLIAALLLPLPAGAVPPLYQPPSEMLFVPLPTPCRAFDVRVNKSETKVLRIGGTAGFRAQKGKVGGCGVPDSATAVSISLSASGAPAAGRATAWPNGLGRPASITTSFPTRDMTTTGATVALGSGKINIFPTQRARLIGDVTGYYVKPLAGMVSSNGTPYAGSSRIVSASRAAVGVYDLVFDRDIRYCTATVTAYSSNYYASASTYYSSNQNSIRVYLWNAEGAPADQYFYISVHC
jgi:hypothetical protein